MKGPPLDRDVCEPAAERRSHRRYLCHTGVLIASGDDVYHAWLDDFSIGGCRICSVGTTLPIVGRIELMIPEVRGVYRCVQGIVVWTNERTMGVRLLHDPPPWLSVANVD